MTEQQEKYIIDIDFCCNRIEIHLKNVINFYDFELNITVIKAIEREFEIIGEALKNLRDKNFETTITDSNKIIGLRNIIAHNYDAVDAAFLWGFIKINLPVLKTEIQNILNNANSNY